MFTPERIESINADRLTDTRLDAALVGKTKAIIRTAKAEGFNLLVAEAFREIAYQNKLYAQGRTTKGKIVTNAKGLQSKHCQGKAIDLVFIVDGAVSWDWKLYNHLGVWARMSGLIWGGDFKSIKDGDHIEVK